MHQPLGLFLAILISASMTACYSSPDEDIIENWNELQEDYLDRGLDKEDRSKVNAEVDAWVAKIEQRSPAVRALLINRLPKLDHIALETRRKRVLSIVRTDPDPVVRVECVEALVALRGPEAIEGLAELLSKIDAETQLLVEREADVRALAARGLGDLNDFGGAAALVFALQDPVLWVRTQAEQSLFRLAGGEKARSVKEWQIWLQDENFKRE